MLPAVAERNLDIMLEFYLGGILNAYLYWLRSCHDMPLDELLALISDNVAYAPSAPLPAEPKLNTKTKPGNQPPGSPFHLLERLPFGHRIPAFFPQQGTDTPPNGYTFAETNAKEAP